MKSEDVEGSLPPSVRCSSRARCCSLLLLLKKKRKKEKLYDFTRKSSRYLKHLDCCDVEEEKLVSLTLSRTCSRKCQLSTSKKEVSLCRDDKEWL